MNIPEREYVDSIYFTGGNGEDWLARIYKRNGGPWELEYRFRYHVDDKAFDSEDKKSHYHATAPDGSPEFLEKARESTRAILNLLAARYGDREPEIVELQCYNDDAKFFFELTSRKWAHVKMVPL